MIDRRKLVQAHTLNEGDVAKLQKRKQISSVKEKNYLLIPDEYMLLKQKVTFKFHINKI